jgi:hypothetical protein
MNLRHYDIIRKDHDKLALWLEAAPDLRAAESRIEELTWFSAPFEHLRRVQSDSALSDLSLNCALGRSRSGR